MLRWFLAEVFAAIELLTKEIKRMSTQLDTLTAQVTANTTVIGSALTLIQGLRDQLAAAGTDPVKLQALADSLKASDDSLAAAVAQNTPAG